MSKSAHIDRFFLFSTAALTVTGFIIFLSASLGLLGRSGATFESVAVKQSISLLLGASVFFGLSRFKYTFFRRTATLVLLGAIGLNLLLFIPGLTLTHNGATRWIDLGLFTFQPSEFLKIAALVYFAAWVHFARDRIKKMRFGLIPYIAVMSILGGLLLIQRDTDTLLIIAFTGLIMFMIAGMPMRHLALAGLLLALLVAGVIFTRPYALERVKAYLDPHAYALDAGYQADQSRIAIGSGGMFGKGFGQSIQKFGYLPQPTDDSIFAVAAEEFGMVGSAILITLYCMFVLSAFRIGTRSPDLFGGMLAVGLAILVASESFLNIAAMIGLVPISGLPLLFVSSGGTALVIILLAAGIVANVSKYAKA